jgi:hypothetical protein
VDSLFSTELSTEDYERLFGEWRSSQEALKKLQAKEFLLRRQLFGHFFPTPREGVNNFQRADGILKGEFRLNRNVDRAALSQRTKEFREEGLPLDKLIDYVPTLKIRPYRALTEEQRFLFDEVLDIKPGAPALKFVLAGQPDDSVEEE